MTPRKFLALAVVLLLPACQVTNLPLWGPAPSNLAAPDACKVERIQDIAYFEDKDADPFRHKLDLYVPQGKKNCPVVVLVHGGAWVMGDNRCCGLYSSVGEFLASHGIVAVLPNYRLSPGVQHPEHIKDVARAFAWTHANVQMYGGRPDQLFLIGHSAGGHLAALLATDASYLKAEGLKTADIKGVVGVSGVYRIPEGKVDVRLGGSSAEAFHLDRMVPLRGSEADGKSTLPDAPELAALSINVFAPAFGDDPKVRQSASPAHHVRAGLPPFLLMIADKDLPLLPALAEEFDKTLRKHGNTCRLLRIDNRNHNSVLFRAIEPSDPAARAILDFIKQNTKRP